MAQGVEHYPGTERVLVGFLVRAHTRCRMYKGQLMVFLILMSLSLHTSFLLSLYPLLLPFSKLVCAEDEKQ